MTEIFTNISDDVKEKAEIMWKIALAQSNPVKAAKILNDFTEYYRKRWTSTAGFDDGNSYGWSPES